MLTIEPAFRIKNIRIGKIISTYEITNDTLVIKNMKLQRNENKSDDQILETETSDLFLKLNGTYKMGK